MRNFYLLFALLISFQASAQVNEGLSPEERAYLFHIVKKSPILDNNFGRYFDYQGPAVIFPNQTLNYDSMELLIINNPEFLVIRKDEIAKSPKGLIAEAANKMAIWELNKVLLARDKNNDDLKQYQNEFDRFEALLKERLPASALRPKDGSQEVHPKIYNVINPGLSLDEKVIMVGSLNFLDITEQLAVLDAINYGVNTYVAERALQIFHNLGGQADSFENVLIAAGDGSGTTGLLEEREKNERGLWNKGLPKAVGLFPYQLDIERTEIKRRVDEKIEPSAFAIQNFETAGNNMYTNVHFDVWGYNSEKQTTVVIEKNGLSYHLFGSGDTRFLSPDSTFSQGATFQSIISDLELNYIAKLDEKIYGKRGYDYWIEYNTDKKNSTELKLKKKEMEYSNMGYTPIATDSKPSRQVKKARRQAIKASSGGFSGAPTTHSQKSERKKLQFIIVGLQADYDNYIKKIKELEVEKQLAIDLRATYELKLDLYKRMMGYNWAEYTVEDGLYTFQDSSTFDFYTQEFQFPPKAEKETFEVRLIAIPESCMSKTSDEVMLHINVMEAKPDYNARINIALEDVFESDKWALPRSLFTPQDSVAVRVFFEGLLDKKIPFEIIARGQGVGEWDGVQTIKDYDSKELDRYPGNASETKMDSTFQRLRMSEVLIHIDRGIVMEINSYTDPVKSSIAISDETISSAMLKYKLTKNDILSAYRTVAIMTAMKKEINQLAGLYMSREEATILIDRFNKEWSKTKINVGRSSFKISSFE